MDVLSAVVFSFYMAFAPNAHDSTDMGFMTLEMPYRVPFDVSLQIYRQALLYPDVEPEEVVTVLIAEHGGKAKPTRFPEAYPSDSLGKDGERGLMQVSDWERRRFGWCHQEENQDHRKHRQKCGKMEGEGLSFKAAELFDAHSNITVGTFALHRIKHIHPGATRCQRGSEVFLPVIEVRVVGGDELEVTTWPGIAVEPFHSWHAHYRCGVKTRDLMLECVVGKRCHDPVIIEGRPFTRACKTQWREELVEDIAGWKRIAFWELPLPPIMDSEEQPTEAQ